jgi:hypothetical protein
MSTLLLRHDHVAIRRRAIDRRSFLRSIPTSAFAAGALSLTDLVGLQADQLRREGRAMILLWMAGGPSQFETFDPKPGQANGGDTRAISTAVPGIQIAEGWERTAAMLDDIAILRSLTNKEGNHQRASYQMHTGYVPSGSVKHPSFAACVAQQLRDAELELPSVVSVGATQGAGFLGVDYEPFIVSNPGQMPQNVESPVGERRLNQRLELFNQLENDFARRGGQVIVDNQRRLYDKAAGIVLSPTTRAFDISEESAAVRESYGDTNFGKGCLLARRLVEAGVSFVEVRMDGWDTHADNFEKTATQAAEVDPAFAALVGDLKSRGMLERTTVLWTGEFGRTPQVNARGGRDHFPRAFNAAIAGGGVRGGQVIGSTTDDGNAIADRPIGVADLLATLCHTLHIDPNTENISPLGRPMKIVDGGTVVEELFG